MKTILLTGGTGFIGRNILPVLSLKYNLLAPRRNELNLLDKISIDNYFKTHKIDIIIHCANSNPAKNVLDKAETFESDMVESFDNIAKYSDCVEKILYLGSGAEFDKRYDMKMIKEEEFGRSFPDTPYGRAKYKINEKIRNSKNIYNLRIFGCYGPTDAKTKFIRDAIDCCIENSSITIRQNCYFDYMYVEDLAYIMEWFIENNPKYQDYNIATGKPIDLHSIAKIVAKKMHNDRPVEIAKDGFNKEYTASNERLLKEMEHFDFTSIEDGIEKQIKWQLNDTLQKV